MKSGSARFFSHFLLFLLAIFAVTVWQSSAANYTIKPATDIQHPTLPDTPYNYRTVELPAHLQFVPRILEFQEIHQTKHFNQIATLGRVLFHDKQLSANDLISCSSCHKQANGFDDPSRFSIGFKGLITARNSIGLANAVFSHKGRFFWDERAENLFKQVLIPFFDPIEMGMTESLLISKMHTLPYYETLFREAFGNSDIRSDRIATALVAFVGSITSFNSPYDQARSKARDSHSDFADFTLMQNKGKHLFFNDVKQGGAGCFKCHQTEAFIAPGKAINNGLDDKKADDQGIGSISGVPHELGTFKPPSLKNIEVRSPYMHDGRFTTLEQVLDHYSTGIRAHPNLGAALRDDNGEPRKFRFTQQEKNALIAFLKTLTDHQLITDPKFSDPFNLR